MAKIALIVGSVRHDRQGIKVARWMEQKLIDRNHVVFFIDPIEINLPLLDRMYKEMTNPSEKLIDLHEKIKAAEGYMPVTPEYNHSTSAAMKNTLDYFLEEYYFKPSAIVSYSPGGFGGINAAQQMRHQKNELMRSYDTSILYRPHRGLNCKTPLDACGIEIEGENKWLTVIQNASKVSKIPV
jgi:NAD(P)H-dependent FMN reductase